MDSRVFFERFVLGLFLILMLFVSVFFLGKHFLRSSNDFTREIRPVMGSYMTITAYFSDQKYLKKSIDEAFDEIKQVENIMSPFIETSELSILNKAAKPGRYKVSDHVWNVLLISDRLNKETEGAFDVTIQPLYNLWKMAEARNKIPTDEELRNTLKSIGWDKIVLHHRSKEIEFTVPDMQLTFGGIASGYAIDIIVNSFRESGIKNFLIDEGGDIFCSGQPGTRALWRIGVKDPLNKSRVFKVLEFKDMAVVTSGNYERYYKIGDSSYSQIFSPKTGLPVKQTVATTVIANDTITADGWSTSLMVLGVDRGIEILKNRKDMHALIISSDNGKLTIKSTPGFSNYEKKDVQ